MGTVSSRQRSSEEVVPSGSLPQAQSCEALVRWLVSAARCLLEQDRRSLAAERGEDRPGGELPGGKTFGGSDSAKRVLDPVGLADPTDPAG